MNSVMVSYKVCCIFLYSDCVVHPKNDYEHFFWYIFSSALYFANIPFISSAQCNSAIFLMVFPGVYELLFYMLCINSMIILLLPAYRYYY